VDFVLSKRAGVPVREQITTQIELKLLSGELKPGERLPSVRALARRLKVHPNTVSAAYRLLQERGHVAPRHGSGVFVLGSGRQGLAESRNLDEMIRLALNVALERYSGPEVRAAVLRWLSGSPPTSIVAIDPSPRMGALLARELEIALAIPAKACTLLQLGRNPERLRGALGVALSPHVEKARDLAPGASIESVPLEVPKGHRRDVLGLPAGAVVLLVSNSEDVLHLASVFLRSIRGDDLLLEPRLLRASSGWKRLISAADFVFADAIAFPVVARCRSQRLREVRLVPDSSLSRLRSALAVVVPTP
jgi:GntR family transcriptional regulator